MTGFLANGERQYSVGSANESERNPTISNENESVAEGDEP